MKLLAQMLGLVLAVTCAPLFAQSGAAVHDGQHDWDSMFGAWKMHLRKLDKPLTGSQNWLEFESHDVTRKVWGGRANLDELEAEGPSGHIEGLTLRLFDRANNLWRIYWVNSTAPFVDVPMIGRYVDGRGEFYDQELFHGQPIYVRYVWSNISDHSGDFEQAFSADGGKSWEPNWVTTMEPEATPQGKVAPNPDIHDGQHDFDWEHGTWRAHLKRLAHPLSESKEWIEYEGTATCSKVWNGRANLVELEVKGKDAAIEGLSLRLFDPKTKQWTLWYANAAQGVLDQVPLAGGFSDGRGEFYGQTQIGGRWVLVHFTFSGITATTEHVEQAFSADGGKSWETNWIADFTRERESQ